MIEKIVRATGIFMRALAGEYLSDEQLRAGMRLIALPNDQLRYTDPSKFPRHTRGHCDDFLRFTPEERCREFLDGISYGVNRGGGSNPSLSAYRIVEMYLNDLPPTSDGRTLWAKVLKEYRAEMI